MFCILYRFFQPNSHRTDDSFLTHSSNKSIYYFELDQNLLNVCSSSR